MPTSPVIFFSALQRFKTPYFTREYGVHGVVDFVLVFESLLAALYALRHGNGRTDVVSDYRTF